MSTPTVSELLASWGAGPVSAADYVNDKSFQVASYDTATGGPLSGTQKQAIYNQNATPSTPQTSAPAVNDLWSTISPYYQGWNQSQALADFSGAFGNDVNKLRQARGGGAASDGGYDYSVYDPVFQAYDEQIKSANENLPLLLDQAQQQHDAISGDLQNALSQGENQFSSQKTLQDQTKLSALAEARRVYGALRQGILSRYGTASSTGAAGSEILAQQTQKDVSQIEQIYLQNLGSLQTQLGNIREYVTRKENEETQRYELDQKQIRKAVSDTVLQIRNNRLDLQSQIGQQKMADLKALKTQLQQLQVDYTNNVAAIRVAAAAEQNNVEGQIKALGQQYAQAQQIIANQTPYQPAIQNYTYSPSPVSKPSKSSSDPYDNLISPF